MRMRPAPTNSTPPSLRRRGLFGDADDLKRDMAPRPTPDDRIGDVVAFLERRLAQHREEGGCGDQIEEAEAILHHVRLVVREGA